MDGPVVPPPNQQPVAKAVVIKPISDKAPVTLPKDAPDKGGSKDVKSGEKQNAADKIEQLAKDRANKNNDADKTNSPDQGEKKLNPVNQKYTKTGTDKTNVNTATPQDKLQSGNKTDHNNNPQADSDKSVKSQAEIRSERHKAEIRNAIMGDTDAVLHGGKLGMSDVSGAGYGTDMTIQGKKGGKASNTGKDNVDATDKKENSDKGGKKNPTSQDKSQAADKVEQLAKQRAEKGTEKTGGKKELNLDSKDKNQSTNEGDSAAKKDATTTKRSDSNDPAELDKKLESLNKQYDSLARRQNEFREEYERTKTSVTEDFERLKSTSETIDGVATVATMVVNLGQIAKEGAKAATLTGEKLVEANAKILAKTKEIATDPIKSAAKDSLAQNIEAKPGGDLLRKAIQFGLKIDKPSTWTQLITGNIEDNHKTVIGNLTRSYNEGNDRFEANKYNVQQKILELNAKRDSIDRSGY